MHRHRRSLWLWQALLAAALATGARWTNASGGEATSSDPLLSGSSDSALTTSGPIPSSTFTWTGTDSSLVRDVASCESEKRAWYSRSSDWYWSSHTSYSYESFTSYSTIWLGNYTGPVSTFCDNVPRASGPAPTTEVPSQVYVNSVPPDYPEPSPTCTFDYHGCELVVSSYRSWYATTHPATVNPPLPPLCEWGPNECIIPYGEKGCRLDAGEVKLIYWPQSKDPALLCASSEPSVTAGPTPTTPRTVVSGGYTFTSPSVYLSFADLRGLPCYKTWSNAIVPVESHAISSLVFGETQPIERTTSMNWNDMNSPVPLSAYKAQQSCWDNWLGVRGTAAGGDGCNTVYDDYLPWLALPTNPAYFTAIDPLFANCTDLFWRKYVFDPPYALTPVGDLLPPTPTARTTNYVAESAVVPSTGAVITLPAMTTIAQPRLRTGATGPVATVGTQTVSADPKNPHNIIVNGETLVPGQISVIDNTPLIMGTGALVVGGSTVSLGAAQTQQVVATVGSQVIEADGTNFIVPGGQTLTPGAVTVINRVTVSVASSALVVGGASTYSLPDAGNGQQPVATVGSQVVSADGANFLLPGGKTLKPGSATVIDGVAVSAGSSALVVDGSSTVPLPDAANQRPVATVGSQVIVADGTNFVLPGSKTLSPSMVTVINSVTVSVAASALVVGGSSTISLAGVGAVLTVGSHTITAQRATSGLFIIGTRTISAGGPAATISGVVVSAADSSVVAVGDGTTTKASVSTLATASTRGTLSAAATSVPAAGWATAQQPTTTSSTRSESSVLHISFWAISFSAALALIMV
ncbi:hypothetical protein MPH_03588 [Macrophomina phaseolina MS6]|uniref:Uncharacterized protein n=1 Tax=Macrophomina phaseolina (strain MS6) TaxID=1126212 RepID=K2RWS5_MACPH|nr:hypothetical protein MPH_03588 [Macrophomina phaseolina MS6]